MIILFYRSCCQGERWKWGSQNSAGEVHTGGRVTKSKPLIDFPARIEEELP